MQNSPPKITITSLARLWPLVVVFGSWSLGCNTGSTIAGAPPASPQTRSSTNADRLSVSDNAGSGTNTSTGSEKDQGDPKTQTPEVKQQAAPIVYPVLLLSGSGKTTCKQDLPTTTTIETSLSDEWLRIKRLDVHVTCANSVGDSVLSGLFGVGGCNQADLDSKIASEANGTTEFERVSHDERLKYEKDGTPLPQYSINARSVLTNTGERFNFDKPLPVFPWPGVQALYKALASGSQSFNANVSGGLSAKVTVTVQKLADEGSLIVLKYTMVLDGDTNDRSKYAKFPLPHEATYYVDPTNKDVRKMVSSDWFTDPACENAGSVNMTYKLCKKTKSGKAEDIPCT